MVALCIAKITVVNCNCNRNACNVKWRVSFVQRLVYFYSEVHSINQWTVLTLLSPCIRVRVSRRVFLFSVAENCGFRRATLLLPALHVRRWHREHPASVQRLPRHHPTHAPSSVRTSMIGATRHRRAAYARWDMTCAAAACREFSMLCSCAAHWVSAYYSYVLLISSCSLSVQQDVSLTFTYQNMPVVTICALRAYLYKRAYRRRLCTLRYTLFCARAEAHRLVCVTCIFQKCR